ncbi:MFS transporter [Myceligenerans indicum]|uniref:MFS transporter n=1 Tax=Myceligenerans indicum TaxID=2593663 RepID=A0ABS1LLC0_9MICO|nr:MFS transporter [Myceligenerans indicum]MBL0887031.1 MFS transporter [Myceligenerans indicum]
MPQTARTAEMSAGRRWAALAVLVLAVGLLAIDATVLYLAVPSLTRDLAPTSTQVLWIGDVYSLAIAGLLITMGTVADRIGRKRLLLIGASAFGAASALAALAPSAEVLIAARLLLGVAGATIMPSTLSLIRTIFVDAHERTRAIAVWSAAAGAGAAVGPLVGGALLEHFWWGSVFLVNVPVVVVLVVAGLVLLPESRDPAPGRLDPMSAALSFATLMPLVYGIKHAVSDGFDPVTIGALVVAAGSGVTFIRRQRHLRDRSLAPLLDIDLFRIPAFSGAVMANFIAIFALTGLLFFFSQYLQLVRGFSPLVAGLAELPATVASIVVVVLVGTAVARLGRGRAIAAGLGSTAIGMVAIAAAEGNDRYVWLALALVPAGLGVGLAMTLTTDAVVSSVPPARSGAASAISETAYELGVALGVAILGSLVSVGYRARLTVPEDVPGDVRAYVTDSLASAVVAAGDRPDVVDAAREAFVGALQTTCLVAAALTLAAAVVAWWLIPSEPADRLAARSGGHA